jgi:hypothetical protein
MREHTRPKSRQEERQVLHQSVDALEFPAPKGPVVVALKRPLIPKEVPAVLGALPSNILA